MVGVQLDILDTHNNIVLLDAILVDTENLGLPPTPPLPPPPPLSCSSRSSSHASRASGCSSSSSHSHSTTQWLYCRVSHILLTGVVLQSTRRLTLLTLLTCLTFPFTLLMLHTSK